jgi:hypothetical protein
MDNHSVPSSHLVLTCGEALAGLDPLLQGGVGVADSPTDLDVRGTVAAHARLRQPGDAHFQNAGCFSGREDRNQSGRQFLLAPANNGLGSHC